MNFYKITAEKEIHHGLQYHDGLNVDPNPFREDGSCVAGGIYFAREDILAFLHRGPWLRTVEIPDDARVVEDPFKPPQKWRADKVILGPRERITAETIHRLVREGADPQVDGDFPILAAVLYRSAEVVEALLGSAARVEPFRLMCAVADCQRTDVLRVLLNGHCDANDDDGVCLRSAARRDNAEMVRLLIEHGINLSIYGSKALSCAVGQGSRKVEKILRDHGVSEHWTETNGGEA